jgi:hypothetical protein
LQRRAAARAFSFDSRLAQGGGSTGAVSNETGGRPSKGGPWPTRHWPRTTICTGLLSWRAEARIGSRRNSNGDPPPEPPPRYEPLDVPALLPFWLGLLIAAFVGGVLLSIQLGFPLAVHQERRGPVRPLPPAPRLESAPAAELQRYEAAKRQELAGHGTIMPIEQAMRATAQQGWGPPK